MTVNDAGKMIVEQWKNLSGRFPNIIIDTFQIMPNHLHGIVIVNSSFERVPMKGTPTNENETTTIGSVIGAFKSISTNVYIDGVKNAGWPAFDRKIWQRNFYESIIPNLGSFAQIRDYILQNPKNWKQDNLFSE